MMLKRPLPDAPRFRNQCTGIGQSRMASERTGASRSQEVIAAAPPRQAAFAKSCGYPEQLPENEWGGPKPGQVARQTTLR
jgi:hypothetical protein